MICSLCGEKATNVCDVCYDFFCDECACKHSIAMSDANIKAEFTKLNKESDAQTNR